MAIEVKQTYRGRKTRELPIHPGVYFRDDPLLFGLADFLVETGRAIEIKGGPQLPEEDSVTVTSVEWKISEPPDPDEQLVSYGPETLVEEEGLPGADDIIDAPDDPLPSTDEDTAEVETPPTPKPTGKYKRG